MISVEQASEIVLQNTYFFDAELVPLLQTPNRILRESLHADRDFPPFDRVTMDGIAIQHAAFENGQKQFLISGVQAAGMPQLTLMQSETCVEVMTGAMLPKGTDTVIRYEDLHIQDGIATIKIDTIKVKQNVHTQGVDRKKGDLIVPIGRLITAAEIGTAATIGKSHLWVSRMPKTAIISTGDELVNIESFPLPHQIRRSNAYSVHALLLGLGINSQIFHFPDDAQTIRKGLQKILKKYELIVLSGAASAGKYDFVPNILEALGVEKLFYQVAQRPGKPFWFGKKNHKNGAFSTIFALPGNPVSTFLCACRYLLPWVKKSLGFENQAIEYAVLSKTVLFKPNLTYFIPIMLENRDGVLYATPIVGNGSGDLATLNDAQGFMELPIGNDCFEAGSVYPIIRY